MGKGWDLLSLDTMGEFMLRTYLEEFLDPDTAATAAAGWGGDRYALLTDPEAGRIFVLLTVWDSTAGQHRVLRGV